MKKYDLKFYPDLVLRRISLPVTDVNNRIRHLIKRMSKIMYRYRGIGLAAPQLGILERVVIADIGEGLISMINPEIITGFGENFLNEGCLSLPEIVVNIKRQESIFVRYLDKNEKESEHELTGLAARVIQHELDHLDGVLIIDYESVLGSLKTNLNNQLKY